MTAFPVLAAAIVKPDYPLADVMGALANTLHRLLMLPIQASNFAVHIDALHYVEFVIFWILGFFTLGAMFYFVIRYRHRSTDPVAPRTPKIQAPLWLEGTVAFGLMGLFMVWWMVGFHQYASRSDPPDDAMTVYAVGKQWVWKFTYEDGPESVGILYLPKDRPVRVLTTSRDVIHSLFIPAFRIKRDAVPGRYNSIWFTPTRIGRYHIMCAEFCGPGHGRMRGDAVVLPPDQFERWIEGYKPDLRRDRTLSLPTPAEPMTGGPTTQRTMAEHGLEVAATKGCFQCHSVDGARELGPSWLGLYGATVPLSGGDSIIADPAYLTESMMQPEAKIVEGFPPIMPTFQGRLSQAEAAAIVEYIKSIRRTP